MKRKEINRLTVIKNGRRIVEEWDVEIEESIQDGGKTLKLFLKSKKRGEGFNLKAKNKVKPLAYDWVCGYGKSKGLN